LLGQARGQYADRDRWRRLRIVDAATRSATTPALHAGFLAPALHTTRFDPEEIQDSADAMVDHLVERRRPIVERRDRRSDDSAELGNHGHRPQVPDVERRLSDHQDEAAMLLQYNVSSAGEEIRGDARGDGREAADGAGGDDHACGLEGAAGQWRI